MIGDNFKTNFFRILLEKQKCVITSETESFKRVIADAIIKNPKGYIKYVKHEKKFTKEPTQSIKKYQVLLKI